MSLNLSAWSLQKDITQEIYPLSPPLEYVRVAEDLTREGTNRRFRSIPIRSLNSLMLASFNPIFHAVKGSWQNPGTLTERTPWVFATERTDNLSRMPILARNWLREEFANLDQEIVESHFDRIRDIEWNWQSTSYPLSLLNPRGEEEQRILFQAIPNYLAQKFLTQPEVEFTNGKKLNFYPVVNLNCAELMSYPTETKDSTSQRPKWISLVISFYLHTLPWRRLPLVYSQVSVRRWLTRPLYDENKNYVPSEGVTVYVFNRFRWLDGIRQNPTFVPIKMYRGGESPRFHRAISELIANNDYLPGARDVAASSLPENDWCFEQGEVKTAIAYNQYLSTHFCKPGISPLDAADIDRAIVERLPVNRVGETAQIFVPKTPFWEPGQAKSRNDPTPKDPNDLSVVMQRPNVATRATFSSSLPLETLLILWKTEKCRDALIEEIRLVLQLQQKGEVSEYRTATGVIGQSAIYSGDFGSLRIKTQHVDNLIDPLLLDNTSNKSLQQKRKEALENRSSLFHSALPEPEGQSAMLIEILRPENYQSTFTDPYLATRIGPMELGYVNQRIHSLDGVKQKDIKQDQSRVKSAVSGLLQQCGILPSPLINSDDGIPQTTWLVCCYILRRTRRTTASGTPNTAVLMVRVNPAAGEVEFTTTTLKQRNRGWVSSWDAYQSLLSEKWEPDSYIAAFPEYMTSPEAIEEQNLINHFVANALQDCLNTAIGNEKKPHVLFMAEAQNARTMLKWLQNPILPSGALPPALRRYFLRQADQKRLSIVRLRSYRNREVPMWVWKKKPGGRTNGVFLWENACDNSNQVIYLSLRELLNTEQGVLKVTESRLNSGQKLAGNPNLLEIAIVHSIFNHGVLAGFLHRLRKRWAYFSGNTSLPFPFPFAVKSTEYCVSARDSVEFLESIEQVDSVED